jgi:O-antigen/teichoic acid export membrane protein
LNRSLPRWHWRRSEYDAERDRRPPPSLRRDIASAYLASASRLLSWILVTALIYRRAGAAAFAVLALVRTTIGLLNYTTLGLGPATIRMLASAKSADQIRVVYCSAAILSVFSAVAAAILAAIYAKIFPWVHVLPQRPLDVHIFWFVLAMGLGTALRLGSEGFGAALQARNRITLDNLLVAGAELLWLMLCSAFFLMCPPLNAVGWAWCVSGLVLLGTRAEFAERTMGPHAFSIHCVRAAAIGSLLSFGLLVALAQAADFLYAPTDNILINRFINPLTVAVYAPAIQIDAGLLLLVGGLAAVLLPRSALAEREQVRKYYVFGTVGSLALLAGAAAAVWLLAAPIFQLWLDDSLPATRAILPLVLIHTVVGGSSAVGRSILLAIGKVKPFTIAVLIAGACNVLLSFVFVRYCGWGLRGIVLGTIIAVVGRCAVWTPWYVLKTIKNER